MKNSTMIQLDMINSTADLYINEQLDRHYEQMTGETEDEDFEFAWFSRLLGVKTRGEDILLLWENEDGDIRESIVPFADIFGEQ